MLSYLRKHSKSWLTKFIFGVIILVFVFWGGSSYWAREATKVAKVDDHIISYQQYSKTYSNAMNAYQEKYGKAFNHDMIERLDLRHRVLDEMINEYIIKDEADRLGLFVSDEDMQDIIRNVPAFMVDGQFDMDRYQRVLSYHNITPRKFEDQQRMSMVSQRLRQIITGNLIVMAPEVDAFYHQGKDTYDLWYLTVNPAEFRDQVKVSQEQLYAFYESHKPEYKVAPESTIEYVVFDVSDYIKDVEVDQEQALYYYDAHKKQYTTPAKIHASHILLRVDPNADSDAMDEKKKLAQDIYDRIESGEAFEVLVERFSEDPGSAQRGGDLGIVDKDILVDGLGDRIFAMEPGQVSGPFKTRFGFHIVRLEEKFDSEIEPFDKVSSSVINKLKEEEAKELAYDQAQSAFIDLYESVDMDLSAYAEARGLDNKTTGPFFSGEKIDLPMGAKVSKAVFAYPSGELGDVMDIGKGFILYKVMERDPSYIPEFAKVKDRVMDGFKDNKARELAFSHAEDMASWPMEKLHKLSSGNTGEFTSTAWAIPGLGSVQGLRDDLDGLQTPKVYMVRNKPCVVWLKEKKTADLAGLDDKARSELRVELLERKKDSVFDSFKEQIRAKHKIVIEEDRI
ncbi:MAG: SurA N-terminal domain-containing protein [Thermodesulfobacteriota bacterium]|nr:SurA N-terminal domain-containing protein [Thermodesulfobacteriota bacterium]